MPFAVFLTADAAGDLEELYDYIALHDAPGKAEQVLAKSRRFSQPVGISGAWRVSERTTNFGNS